MEKNQVVKKALAFIVFCIVNVYVYYLPSSDVYIKEKYNHFKSLVFDSGSPAKSEKSLQEGKQVASKPAEIIVMSSSDVGPYIENIKLTLPKNIFDDTTTKNVVYDEQGRAITYFNYSPHLFKKMYRENFDQLMSGYKNKFVNNSCSLANGKIFEYVDQIFYVIVFYDSNTKKIETTRADCQ